MSKLIDVHTHVTPYQFPECPGEPFASKWPCMRCGSNVEATLMIGDRPFRQLDDRSWDLARRLTDMDRDGVDVQVLSPMPELLSYWLDLAGAEIICDHVNAQIAGMVSASPSRFTGLGALPLQNPAGSGRYLERIRSEFGLIGVEIGSNINGHLLGERMFDPFWEAAESLNMAVFVHALHPVATKSLDVTPTYTAFAGFPIDVAMSAASMMLNGTLQRYPKLRVAFSHGGGALTAILGRLDRGWTATGGYGIEGLEAPSIQAARFFYDSNVYDAHGLSSLATGMAPGHVFAGTDYPYLIQQEELDAYLRATHLGQQALDDLREGAARRFLNTTFE
ncbi:MAG: amidohydrolase [Hyphomonadaceae bacterium]|nr:amidohydrolase [Hyphomonadaceae bacterium]MBA27665.1 amidohydrolase [Hyphomonadaceae bacterium]